MKKACLCCGKFFSDEGKGTKKFCSELCRINARNAGRRNRRKNAEKKQMSNSLAVGEKSYRESYITSVGAT